MAKAASPIRLQQSLMKAAAQTGARFHRSTAEQVEYWADLGRRVSSVLDPDSLLSVISGLARVQVEPIYGQAVSPDAVFEELEQQRKQGTLSEAITGNTLRYQASSTHPGYLEQITPEGTIKVGQFQNGQFVPAELDGG